MYLAAVLACAVLVSTTSADTTCAGQIYLSPSGSDTKGNGSSAAPYASLQRAQAAARKLGGASVLLTKGEYHISSTLSFDGRDSGQPGCPVVWKAADPSEEVIISGGTRIPPQAWQAVAWPGAASGSVVAADVSGLRNASEGTWPFQQLTVDGLAWPVARWPLKPPGMPYNESWLFTTSWSRVDHGKQEWAAAREAELGRVEWAFPAWLGVNASLLPLGAANSSQSAMAALKGSYVDLYGYYERDTGNQMLPVLGVDGFNNATRSFRDGEGKPPLPATGPGLLVHCYGFQPYTRFVLRNIQAGLRPGQWWLDPEEERVYLWLPAGMSLDTLRSSNSTVAVPHVDRIFDVAGTQWISFQGLTFTGAGGQWAGYWSDVPNKPHMYGDYALALNEGSSQISITRCTFRDLNTHGVGIFSGSNEIVIQTSLFQDLGQGGVVVAGVDVPAPGNTPFGVTVDQCVFQRLGTTRKNIAGVGIHGASYCRITNSRFENLPHQGIGMGASLRKPERLLTNILVQGNVIHRTNTETDDTGAIVVYMEQIGFPLNQTYYDMSVMIRHNNVSDTVDASSKDDRYVCVHGESPDPQSCRNHSWSIYLDGAASGVTIDGNILSGTLQGSVYFHQGGNNNVTNNIIVNGRTTQLMFGPQRDNYGSTVERNVFQWRDRTSSVMNTGDYRYWSSGVLAGSDWNLFWCPDISVNIWNGTGTDHPLFPKGKSGGLIDWQRVSSNDAHSKVGDPCFAAPQQGNFTMCSTSPAWSLGFRPIPDIRPPDAADVGSRSLKQKSSIQPNAMSDLDIKNMAKQFHAFTDWRCAHCTIVNPDSAIVCGTE